MSDVPFFLDKELLSSCSPIELALRAKRQADDVMIFGRTAFHDFEGHGDVGVERSISSRSLAGGAHGQDQGLIQGNVA